MYRVHSILLRVKTIIPSYLLPTTLFLVSSFVIAGQGNHSPAIFLKSCKIDIRADKVFNRSGSIDYYGNVQFLYGLANVKTDRVTLIKYKDGSCKLVANHWVMKNDNQ
jgi:hypothetical protein